MGLGAVFRRQPFLTPTERQQLADGLAHACRHAQARISLVIEERTRGDAAGRAAALFQAWEISPGERPMAVLVYACAATRRFAVIGGEAIRRVAPAAFWEEVEGELERHFADERYCDGLFKAIARVALEIERHTGGGPHDRMADPLGG